MKNTATPKTKTQKALSLLLTLLMVLGTLSVIGPISVAAETLVTVKFMASAEDETPLASVQKDIDADGNGTLSAFINDPSAASAKALELCKKNTTPGEDGIYRATVFAGWKDVDDDTVYTNSSQITGDVTVCPTYIDNAIIFTAAQMNDEDKTNANAVTSGAHNSFAFVEETQAFHYVPKSGKSHLVRYMFTAPISSDNIKYIAVKGKQNIEYGETTTTTWKRSFARYQDSAKADVGSAVYSPYNTDTGTNKGTFINGPFLTVFDMSNGAGVEANTSVYGIKFAPWAGQTIPSETNGYMDLEWMAIIDKSTAAEYIDIAKYLASTASTVTLGNENVTINEGTTLGRLLAENKSNLTNFDFQKTVKDASNNPTDDYAILTGLYVTSTGASEELRGLDYEIQKGDVISLDNPEYSNIYVYTPEQLIDLFVPAQTRSALVPDGNDTVLQLKTTHPEGHIAESKDAWASIRAYFQLTEERVNSSLSNNVRPTRSFKIGDVPYYTISYKTNINVDRISNNMYIDKKSTDAYSPTWTTPYTNRVVGASDYTKFPIDVTEKGSATNPTSDAYPDGELNTDAGITAIRMSIYHQGNASIENFAVSDEDYFNIKYLGFFPSKESEALFDYNKYRTDINVTSVKAVINGTDTKVADNKLLHTVVKLPLGTVDTEHIWSYTDADRNSVTEMVVSNSVKPSFTALKTYAADANDYIINTNRGKLENLRAAIDNNKKLTVAYLGGSVTYGQGATGNGYAHQTTKYLQEKYPNITVTPIYAGIGATGSRLGAFRAQEQIIEKKPDLVFIEYAVNDPSYDEGLGKDYNGLYYEYIIRQIREQLPNTEIIALYTTNAAYATGGGMNGTIKVAGEQDEIASSYGVVGINVGDYMIESLFGKTGDEINYPAASGLLLDNNDEKIDSESTLGAQWLKFFTDHVHPNANGYAIYTEAIKEYLETIPTKGEKADHQVPEAMYGADWFAAKTIDLNGIAATGFTYDTRNSNEYTEMLTPDGTDPYSISFPFGADSTQLGLALSSRLSVGDYFVEAVITDDTGKVMGRFPEEEGTKADLRSFKGYKNIRQNVDIFKSADIASFGLEEGGSYTATLTFDIKYIGHDSATEPAEIKYRSIYAIMLGGEVDSHKITVNATEGGAIESVTGGRNNDDGTYSVIDGKSITLKAKADENYVLRNRYEYTPGGYYVALEDEGDVLGGSHNPYTIKPERDMKIEANFISASYQAPIRLIAMLYENASYGWIKVDNDESLHSTYDAYKTASEPTKLKAVVTNAENYRVAYWQRVTGAGNVNVFITAEDTIEEALPLGSEVYYTPVFEELATTTVLYIDGDTNEILYEYADVPAEAPVVPAMAGWNGSWDVGTASTDGKTTVYRSEYTLENDYTNAMLSVIEYGKTEEKTFSVNPAFGAGYIINASKGVTNPIWKMTVNGGTTEYVIGVGATLNFNYMFNVGTKIVIKETVDTAPDIGVINTITTWDEVGYRHFTGSYVLPDGATLVEHGVLMSKSNTDLDGIQAATNGNGFATTPDGTIVGRVNVPADTDATPIFTVSKKLADAEEWYGRAYMIYTDKDGEYHTVFGDTIPTV